MYGAWNRAGDIARDRAGDGTGDGAGNRARPEGGTEDRGEDFAGVGSESGEQSIFVSASSIVRHFLFFSLEYYI